MDYQSALTRLGKRDSRKIENNTHLHRLEDGAIGLRLHQTDILLFYPDRTIAYSGGWHTVTTKARLNSYMPHSVGIRTSNGMWHVYQGPTFLGMFAEGMTIGADGQVLGIGLLLLSPALRSAAKRAGPLLPVLSQGE